MRTPDMSDEELDRLFQRGAEAFPDEDALAGWLRLETQLEEVTRQQLQRRELWQRVTGLFVAELAVVALFLLLWLAPSGSGLGPNARPERALPVAVQSNPSSPSTSSVPPPSAGQTTQPAPGQKGRKAALGQSATVVAHSLTNSEKFGTAAKRSGRSGRPLRISRAKRPFAGVASLAAGSSRPYRQALGQLAEKPAADAATNTPQPTAASGLAEPGPNKPAVTTQVPVAAAAVSVVPDSAAATEVAPAISPALPSLPADSSQHKQHPKRPAYRLLVGVVGGPELAAVLPSPTPRAGGTVGAVLEYRLTDRLRVRTGLLRSVKRYGARGSDYRPPAGYWTWNTPVDAVDANCRILEIPLDFRYDLMPREAYSFYASAGLTSLMLRNERYTYHYELNGQYQVRTWSYPKGGNQALQMLRLAAGYERRVAPRWMLQAEPFVNIPLSGVGFGRMRLSSTGLLLGLRYGLGHAPAAQVAP